MSKKILDSIHHNYKSKHTEKCKIAKHGQTIVACSDILGWLSITIKVYTNDICKHTGAT